MKIDGACHCGYITYEAEIDPERVVVCHCTDCQVMSGSAFRTIAFAREGTFKVLSGEPKIYVKIGGSGAERPQSFCPECGTPIYGTSAEAEPKTYGLRMGSIRQRDTLVPKMQIWTRPKHDWVAGLGSINMLEKQ